MLGPYWIPSREDLVTSIERLGIQSALENEYDVIVDATNFRPQELIESISGEFELSFKDFTNVSLRDCIERDKKREQSVGEEVIMRMYNKYLKPK